MYIIKLKYEDTIDEQHFNSENEVLRHLAVMKPDLKSRLYSLTTMDYGKNAVTSVHNLNNKKILEIRTYIANGKIAWIDEKVA